MVKIFDRGNNGTQKPAQLPAIDYDPHQEPDYDSHLPETEVHKYYGRGDRTSPPPHSEEHLTLLAEAITKMPLNDIANDFLKLTYGEMVQMVQEIWKVSGERPLDIDTLPKVMHAWATFKKTGEMPEAPVSSEVKKNSQE